MTRLDADGMSAGGSAAVPSPAPNSLGSTTEAVAAKLQAAETMDYAALRDAWRRLYRVAPPRRVSRDLLLLGVAWKVQELAYGGLGATTRRRLNELVQALEQDGDIVRDRVARLKPGARIIRAWGGTTHTVVVHDEGFTWNGRRWRSLSAIAQAITGAKWSGPRFFGLKGTAVDKGEPDLAEPSDG